MQENTGLKKVIYILIGVGILLYLYPYLIMGLVNNDELLARYWNMQGFKTSFMYYFQECNYKGRTLSSWIIPITVYLGFLGQSAVQVRFLQMIIILINVVLFRKLLVCITQNVHFADFVCIIFLALLPLNYEPSLPSAYNSTYGIIFALFLVSMILYYKGIIFEKKANIIASMMLFFVTICGYEAFITYIPIYIVFAYYLKNKNSKFDIKNGLKESLYPIITGILFIIVYVIAGKIYPSNYEGTQVSFSIPSAIKVMLRLFGYSFPMVTNLATKRYLYLLHYYMGNLRFIDYIRIICVCAILTFFFCCKLTSVNEISENKKNKWHHVLAVAVGIAFVFLPTLPLAISKMYQQMVGEEGFLALPVTYFGYFGAVFTIGYILWNICSKLCKQHKVLMIILGVIFLCGSFALQMSNATLANQSNANYERIQRIESLFETDNMENLQGQIMSSPDLYRTMNGIGVHDGYWTSIAVMNGLNIQVVNEEDSSSIYGRLIELSDELYCVVDANTSYAVVFSKQQLNKPVAIKIKHKEFVLLDDVENYAYDHNWYVYYWTRK